jgi:hypothetical protein
MYKTKKESFPMEEDKAYFYQKGISRKEAIARLIDLIKNNDNKPIVIENINNGEKASLSKNSINKLISSSAFEKSMSNGFTKEQHFAAVSEINDLYKNSVKVLERPDRDGDPNVKAIHKFVALLFGNNAAYITVKEATEQGKRIYTVELMELGKLEGHLNEVKPKFLASNPTTSLPIINIQIFQEKTKNS